MAGPSPIETGQNQAPQEPTRVLTRRDFLKASGAALGFGAFKLSGLDRFFTPLPSPDSALSAIEGMSVAPESFTLLPFPLISGEKEKFILSLKFKDRQVLPRETGEEYTQLDIRGVTVDQAMQLTNILGGTKLSGVPKSFVERLGEVATGGVIGAVVGGGSAGVYSREDLSKAQRLAILEGALIGASGALVLGGATTVIGLALIPAEQRRKLIEEFQKSFSALFGVQASGGAGGLPENNPVQVSPTYTAEFTRTPTPTLTLSPTATSTETEEPTPTMTMIPSASPSPTETPIPTFQWSSGFENGLGGWNYDGKNRMQKPVSYYEIVDDPTGSGRGKVYMGLVDGDPPNLPETQNGEKHRPYPDIFFPFKQGDYSVGVDVFLTSDLSPTTIQQEWEGAWASFLSVFSQPGPDYELAYMVNLLGNRGNYRLDTRSFHPSLQGESHKRISGTPKFPTDQWVSIRVDVDTSRKIIQTFQNDVLVAEGPYLAKSLGIGGMHAGLYGGNGLRKTTLYNDNISISVYS